jgi:voltage-gated potassium channel Kch
VKPVVVFLLLVWRGYKTRTAFLTGVSLSQVSEFSLILGALGLSLNLISPQIATLLTLVTIISIGISSYALQYSSQLYTLLAPALRLFEQHHASAEVQSDMTNFKHHIVLVGADRLGREIAHALAQLDTPFIIVDQNPDVALRYRAQNIPVVCGDITDSHIQQLIHLDKAQLVISTVPDRKDTESLVQTIKSQGWPIKLILTADDEAEAKRLYGQGVDYTLLPHFIGGLHLAKLIEEHTLLKSLKKLREQQQKRFARTA